MFLLRVSEASKKRSQWRRPSDSSEGSQPIDAHIAAQTGSRGLSVSAFLATNVSDQLLSLHWQVLATCQGEMPVVKRELCPNSATSLLPLSPPGRVSKAIPPRQGWVTGRAGLGIPVRRVMRSPINKHGSDQFSPLAALAALDLFRLCGLVAVRCSRLFGDVAVSGCPGGEQGLPPPRAAISIPFQIPALGLCHAFFSGFIFFKHPPCSLLSSVYASFFGTFPIPFAS